MKRVLLALACTALAAVPLRANPFEDFRNNAVQSVLVPFARDLGGLFGASDFHSARVPGLAGFDIGLVTAIQFEPSDGNLALKNAGVQAFGLPLLIAEAGLPFGLGVFLRGLPIQGATIFGGGVRYQIHKSGLMIAIPDISVTVGYDKLTHDVLDLSHLGGSVQASFNLPIVKPFVGLGYDSTEIKVKTTTGAAAILAGSTAKGKGSRLTVGANLTLIPFTYLFGSYSLLHGESGAQVGLGVRFGGVL